MGWSFSFFPVDSYREHGSSASWDPVSEIDFVLGGLGDLADDGMDLWKAFGVQVYQGDVETKFHRISVDQLKTALIMADRMTETVERNTKNQRKDRICSFFARALNHAQENNLTEMGMWGG